MINPIDVLVGQVGTVSRESILRIASWLWDRGVRTEIFYENQQKVGEQIKIAANKGAKWLVLAGEDELKEGQLILRDLTNKT